MKLQEELTKLSAEMTALRQEIHQNPEIGWEEVETRRILKEKVKHIGKVTEMAQTGMIVDLVGTGPPSGKPKIVALRTDLDALPMTEANSSLAYRSKNVGKAHMCGHDGHMASLTFAALLLHAAKDRIPSDCTVRFLYQPAEEGLFGAPKMIEDGCLEGVTECYGFHNWPGKLGSLAVKPGAMMAHSVKFDIMVTGKGGHASRPEGCVDPIVVGSSIVTQIQTIISRTVSCREAAVVSVCTMSSGETHNVIPDTCEMKGTIRDFNSDVFETICRKLRAIVQHTCEMHGATGTVTISDGYPVVMNHPKETEIVREVATQVFGAENVSDEGLPINAAEDFSYYLQNVPGCFYFLGMNDGEIDKKHNTLPHSTTFNFNDKLLPIAAKFYVKLIENRFGVSLLD